MQLPGFCCLFTKVFRMHCLGCCGWLLRCCYGGGWGFRIKDLECCYAVLGCCGWLPGCCYVVAMQFLELWVLECCYVVFRVLWVISRVLLWGGWGFRIMDFRMLLCRFGVLWVVDRVLLCGYYAVFRIMGFRMLMFLGCCGWLPGCCYGGE